MAMVKAQISARKASSWSLLVSGPGVRSFFFAKSKERLGYGRVMFDKMVVEVTEAKEGLEVFKLFRDGPLCDFRDFCGVHFNVSFRYNDAEVFNGSFVKETFFGF